MNFLTNIDSIFSLDIFDNNKRNEYYNSDRTYLEYNLNGEKNIFVVDQFYIDDTHTSRTYIKMLKHYELMLSEYYKYGNNDYVTKIIARNDDKLIILREKSFVMTLKEYIEPFFGNTDKNTFSVERLKEIILIMQNLYKLVNYFNSIDYGLLNLNFSNIGITSNFDLKLINLSYEPVQSECSYYYEQTFLKIPEDFGANYHDEYYFGAVNDEILKEEKILREEDIILQKNSKSNIYALSVNLLVLFTMKAYDLSPLYKNKSKRRMKRNFCNDNIFSSYMTNEENEELKNLILLGITEKISSEKLPKLSDYERFLNLIKNNLDL